MTRKHFIVLANIIRGGHCPDRFTTAQIATIASFLQSCNPRFNRTLWEGYVTGKCTANGKPIN